MNFITKDANSISQFSKFKPPPNKFILNNDYLQVSNTVEFKHSLGSRWG